MANKSEVPAADNRTGEAHYADLGGQHAEIIARTFDPQDTMEIYDRGAVAGWVQQRRDGGFYAVSRGGDQLGRFNTPDAAAVAIIIWKAL